MHGAAQTQEQNVVHVECNAYSVLLRRLVLLLYYVYVYDSHSDDSDTLSAPPGGHSSDVRQRQRFGYGYNDGQRLTYNNT